MKNSMRSPLFAAVILAMFVALPLANASEAKDPFGSVVLDKKDLLQQRLNTYVTAYKHKDWKTLYGLISDTGRGDAPQKFFISQMKAEHEVNGSEPDLLEFLPDRTKENKPGFDLFGCGKASREGRGFKGIALVHVVFEHDNWFFSGWNFTEFPNESCDDLKKPDWAPYGAENWNQQMIELRPIKGTPFHIN
jgi:hypothetical protein